MAIIAVTALVTGVFSSIFWAAHLIQAGARDSGDLSSKLSIPHPRRAADWPEIRLDAVVVDPEGAARVLVIARWPAHPATRALLMLEVDEPAAPAHRLLFNWRDIEAPLSPRALAGDRLVLRRRRTNDLVSAIVLGESACTSETSR